MLYKGGESLKPKLVVVSPEGDSYIELLDEKEEHVDVLKNYLHRKRISYDKDINNGHKLCLDLSRDGYFIFRVGESSSVMYIGKDISQEQFYWFTMNAVIVDKFNVVSIASWYNPDSVSGYDVIEDGDVNFDTLNRRKEKIVELFVDKNKAYEKKNKTPKMKLF